MAAPNVSLPMLQCTSCNYNIGHLFIDYYKMTRLLNKLIDDKFDFKTDVEGFITTGGDTRDIYKQFIQPYYLYSDDEDKKLFETRAIIAYALFNFEQLKAEHFPLRSLVNKMKYCCTRMLFCSSDKIELCI
jgi:DNA-directed RNA polymerase subunit N (RpoN/RPB10)